MKGLEPMRMLKGCRKQKEFQFSYKDDQSFYFMDTTNFEQITLRI